MVQNDKYKPTYIDDTTNSIRVDYSKCIDCGTCLENCGGGFLIKDGHIQAFWGFGLKASGCTSCGKCAESFTQTTFHYKGMHFWIKEQPELYLQMLLFS